MVCDISSTVQNNKQSFKKMLGYSWYVYSNIPLALGMILVMTLIRVCVGEIDSTKLKYKRLRTHVRHTFQTPSPPKRFRTFGMFWEDSGSET